MHDFLTDKRFAGIEPFGGKLYLSSPTMHGDEQHWVNEAFDTNWVSTVGENIDTIERQLADYVGVGYAVALTTGTTALHLATKLAAERLYGLPKLSHGTLEGKRVFCSDLTFNATTVPVVYECGAPVFIDTERDTWNMDPASLEKAFREYPDVKLVMMAHLYGTPAKMQEIKQICDAHGALIVEDAAESLGAKCLFGGAWVETGSLGDYNCISFNGNKIITGSSGGMFLTDSKEDADKVRKWSTQSREPASWYQHTELGYNYRMSNIVAGIIRGQLLHLDEHVAQKKAIYERYKAAFEDLPVCMNPYDAAATVPNHWLSCLTIDEGAMAPHTRGDLDESWETVPGKSSPGEIIAALAAFGAEARPIWKPMHMQPLYATSEFVAASGEDVSADIFRRGVCLPSDNKMTEAQQAKVIEIVRRCFG